MSSVKDESEAARYLCRIIDNGHTSIGLKWETVVNLISVAISSDREKVGEILEAEKIGFHGNLDAGFLVHGVYDAEVTSEDEEAVFSNLVKKIGDSTDLVNILLMVSTEYGLTLDLVDFILHDADRVPEGLMDNPYIALITSDLFLESGTVNSFIKNQAGRLPDQMEEVIRLSRKNWFLNLLEILRPWNPGLRKDGSNVFSGTGTGEPNQKQLYSLIAHGTLPWIMLNRNRILKEKPVMEAFRRKQQIDTREKQLKKFYYWLGIANDFVLGVLFLVGSFEFLPHGNEFAGVIMFIVGSSQLVGRSVIQIVMNMHVNARRKKLAET